MHAVWTFGPAHLHHPGPATDVTVTSFVAAGVIFSDSGLRRHGGDAHHRRDEKPHQIDIKIMLCHNALYDANIIRLSLFTGGENND